MAELEKTHMHGGSHQENIQHFQSQRDSIPDLQYFGKYLKKDIVIYKQTTNQHSKLLKIQV